MSLKDVRVGAYIWTTKSGWAEVTYVANPLHNDPYPIQVATRDSYTLDGKYHVNDAGPSAFIDPPQGFNAGPRPSRFTKDEPVYVAQMGVYLFQRAYFSHDEAGKVFCFIDGKTSWSSNGKTIAWDKCVKAPEREVKP